MLFDFIQIKVNYVVQEVIVVIKDIFCKYFNKYESVIVILCENLDFLDEFEVWVVMIWIVGEYVEWIDNVDELLESFFEGFYDESIQVQLQLLIVIVKFFLKKLIEIQELVQQVFSLVIQDLDNLDLWDCGYIYWCLLFMDLVVVKEVVLVEKLFIFEEMDFIEFILLDEFICYIGMLVFVYYKFFSVFVEGGWGVVYKSLLFCMVLSESVESFEIVFIGVFFGEQLDVIFVQGDLLGDFFNLDFGFLVSGLFLVIFLVQMGVVDFFGGGFDSLIGGINFVVFLIVVVLVNFGVFIGSGLSDFFDLISGVGILLGLYVVFKVVWFLVMKVKGLEILGIFICQVGFIFMDLQLINKVLQVMIDFVIQFNCNSFGLVFVVFFQVYVLFSFNQIVEIFLFFSMVGLVMKMEFLNNFQVVVKNNIDVFYFSILYLLYIFFVEDGKMDWQMFLVIWKDIFNENEVQFQIRDCFFNVEVVSSKLQSSNIFIVVKRNVEGQDMFYQFLKLINGIWVLVELWIQLGNFSCMLFLKC